MATSYGALCSDFYINQKLALKMDLPSDRETVLHFYDRVRKAIPQLERFHRYGGELVLESSRRDEDYQWLTLRKNSVRTGHVNPQSMERAHQLHRLILELVPYHLTISALDVDHLELQFGFDLECDGNHDEVVAEALLADSPLGEMIGLVGGKLLDVQPIIGMSLSEFGDLQAYFDVKTRRRGRRGSSKRFRHEPINICLTVRRFGPIEQVDQLPDILDQLSETAESLVNDRLVPHILTPIARQIPSRRA